MSRFRTGVVFVVVALAGGLVPVVLTGGSEAAAAAPTCVLPPPSGGIISLTGDCDTTVPLIIPDGITINGNGHTITAHDPTGGFFTGAVLANAGTTMNVENQTIQGTGFATNCAVILTGIFFDNAGGSVTGVTVTGITQHSGCQLGLGIRANALNGVPQTVTIAKTTVTDYQKGGLVASGMMTMNVSGSTVGPPDSLDGTIAQNGVQYGGTGSREGAGGTITASTISGSGFGSATDDGTAVLLFAAKNVTVSQDTITGAGTDVGISVATDTFVTPSVPSTGITISHNQIGRTSADSPDSFGFGVSVDEGSMATLICNTFTNWITDIVGAVQAFCITTTALPPGTECHTYSAPALAAVSGTLPYHWSVASGTLPPGLSLSATGVISGTPTAAGTFNFTAHVADSASPPLTATQAEMLVIAPDCATPPTPPSTTTPPSAPVAPISHTVVPVTG